MEYPGYSTWLNLETSSRSFQRKLKKSGPGLLLLNVLQKFRATHQRDPSFKTREADLELLRGIRDDQVPNSTLADEALGVLFAQISPAVAIVGGVVAQEVIKVVTKLEAPHRNLFVFDPQTCAGYIENIEAN